MLSSCCDTVGPSQRLTLLLSWMQEALPLTHMAPSGTGAFEHAVLTSLPTKALGRRRGKSESSLSLLPNWESSTSEPLPLPFITKIILAKLHGHAQISSFAFNWRLRQEFMQVFLNQKAVYSLHVSTQMKCERLAFCQQQQKNTQYCRSLQLFASFSWLLCFSCCISFQCLTLKGFDFINKTFWAAPIN